MNRPQIIRSVVAIVLGTASQSLAQCEIEDIAGLIPSGSTFGSAAGSSVMISDTLALVGASRHDALRGTVFLFRRSGSEWVEATALQASDGQDGDRFGTSMALSGRAVLVGAAAATGSTSGSGSAYLFLEDGGVWAEDTKLFASDGDTSDLFGQSVALDGSLAVVGAPLAGEMRGSVYVFEGAESEWRQTAKLTASDGRTFDQFGDGVLLSQGWLFVSAPRATGRGSQTGAVYVFEHHDDGWVEVAKLFADDGEIQDGFGRSLCFDGQILLVGAPWHDALGMSAGAAYLFAHEAGVWTQVQKLVAPDGEPLDLFGVSAAFVGDSILVGAPHKQVMGGLSGLVYIYRAFGQDWLASDTIESADTYGDSEFGVAISVAGHLSLIGSPRADPRGVDSGAAYIVEIDCDCKPDLNADWIVDSRDFVVFMNLWAGEDVGADWNGNGAINTQDIVAYLIDWVKGC